MHLIAESLKVVQPNGIEKLDSLYCLCHSMAAVTQESWSQIWELVSQRSL